MRRQTHMVYRQVFFLFLFHFAARSSHVQMEAALDAMSLQPGVAPVAVHAANAIRAREAGALSLSDLKRAKKSVGDAAGKDMLPQLTPAQQAPYKSFWRQFSEKLDDKSAPRTTEPAAAAAAPNVMEASTIGLPASTSYGVTPAAGTEGLAVPVVASSTPVHDEQNDQRVPVMTAHQRPQLRKA